MQKLLIPKWYIRVFILSSLKYPEASVSEEGAEITTPGTGCDSCVWDGKTVEYIPRDGCEHFP